MRCPQCKREGAREIQSRRNPKKGWTWMRCAFRCSGGRRHVFPVRWFPRRTGRLVGITPNVQEIAR